MAEGVDEARGKCRIRWYENGKRRSEVLEFPYTKAGIKRAAAVRQQYIKAAERGETALRETPTFGELAQTRLNTAQLTPETRRTQKIYLNKYWMDWAGDVPIDEVRYDDIVGLKSLDLAPKTIKHILSAGSAVFWAHKVFFCACSPSSINSGRALKTPTALFVPTLATASAGEIIAVTMTPARAPNPAIPASACIKPRGRSLFSDICLRVQGGTL